MPKVLVNKTILPVDAYDELKRRITIGPGNAYTESDNGIADRILANATIANFRVAETRDGWVRPES